jgi:two-component system sensor histidine kinase MprB
LTVAGGGAVFLALAVASLVIYFDVRSRLHDQVDVSLIQTAQNLAMKWSTVGGPKSAKIPAGKLPAGTYTRVANPKLPHGPLLGTFGSGYFQVIPSVGEAVKNGGTAAPPSTTTTPTTTSAKGGPTARKGVPFEAFAAPNGFVPLSSLDVAVANGRAAPYFRDVRYQGVAMRLYALRLSATGDGLVRTARALTEANATIGRVRWLLIGLTLGGAFAAALLGRLAAAAVLRPLRSLAATVGEVTATRDLQTRIPVDGRDEIASLARDFNAMLSALDDSQRTQQQLIADASNELRTPLTAHRANVELLAREDLPLDRRPHVLGAAVRGIEELSMLVNDLIQAARNGRSLDARAPVSLDRIVAAAVERARQRAPALRFTTALEPYSLEAASRRVERALDNVLDNAVKWSSPSGEVEVVLSGGAVSVRDYGPGIEEGDLPHVFDRFYRAAAARALPGSGLGLAIVKQTVEDHGGSVSVANADGGGVAVTLRFDPPPL